MHIVPVHTEPEPDPVARLDICVEPSTSSISVWRRFFGLLEGLGTARILSAASFPLSTRLLNWAFNPPGLWLYHPRLLRTLPSVPHLLHMQRLEESPGPDCTGGIRWSGQSRLWDSGGT